MERTQISSWHSIFDTAGASSQRISCPAIVDVGEKIQLLQMSAGSHHPNESCALANSRLLPIPKHLTSYLHEIGRTLLLHFVLRDDLVVIGRQPSFPNESWVIFYYDRRHW